MVEPLKKYLVMKMYEEIETILSRTLSPFEYEKIEELLKTYTEEQVMYAYKNSPVKHINYITKFIKSQRKTPSWLHKEIINEPIDEETKKEQEDFKTFIEDFRKC